MSDKSNITNQIDCSNDTHFYLVRDKAIVENVLYNGQRYKFSIYLKDQDNKNIDLTKVTDKGAFIDTIEKTFLPSLLTELAQKEITSLESIHSITDKGITQKDQKTLSCEDLKITEVFQKLTENVNLNETDLSPSYDVSQALENLKPLSSTTKKNNEYPNEYIESNIIYGCSVEVLEPQKRFLDEPKFFRSKEDLEKYVFITEKKPENNKKYKEKDLKKGITQSSNYCYDYQNLMYLDASTKAKLNLDPKKSLKTHTHLLKNSTLNGLYYEKKEEDKDFLTEVQISSAITSSYDRVAKNLQMGRAVLDLDLENCESFNDHPNQWSSICYTGRPDSEDKAKELVEMMFLTEMQSQKSKGLIQKENDPDSYTFNFVVNSLLSPTSIPFLSKEEKEILENEVSSFQALQKKIIKIKDLKNPEKIYKVKINPIFFSNQLNIFSSLEKVLPDKWSGKKTSEECSKKGIETFNQLIETEKKRFPNISSRSAEDNQKFQMIKDAKEALQDPSLESHEQIFNRIFLCHLLELPFVAHCKSSTDRTSVIIALACCLKQLLDKAVINKLSALKDFSLFQDDNGKYVPHKILKNEDFKELFLANIYASLPISKYSRGSLGLKWGETIFDENPFVKKLLPKRFLISDFFGTRFKRESLLQEQLLYKKPQKA